MHELFRQVLNERDLSRAGDLFSVPDSDIITDLNEVIKKITEISSHPNYAQNDNDQSVVEICVTRVTSCVRETGSVETFCGALVALLEACLHHNLRPTSNHRDDDPPHAKIASDVISCIFLASDSQNYSKRGVMEAVLPVAVKFLHKGNRELFRNMARYISLAAIHHAKLLKPHVQPIMDSIISGNYPLCRVLSQLYEVCPEPLGGHAMALVSLLPHAEQSEKLSLLSLFELMASRDPEVLEASVSQLVAYLCPHTASPNAPGCVCVGVLKVLLALSSRRGSLLIEHLSAIRLAGTPPHASPLAVTLVAQILTRLGHTTKERAQAALNFVVESMCASERGVRSVLWREATSLCSAYPALFSDSLLAALTTRNSEVNQTPAGVTIVKLGGGGAGTGGVVTSGGGGVVGSGGAVGSGGVVSSPGVVPPPAPPHRRPRLGDSRSTGRLHTPTNTHRSMTKLHVAGGSVGGLHKSMTRLTSSQQMNQQQPVAPKLAGRPVTVTVSPRNNARPNHHHNIYIPAANNTGPTIISGPTALPNQSISVNPLILGKSSDMLPTPISSSISVQHSTALGHVSIINPNNNNNSSGVTIGPNSNNTVSIGPNMNPIGPNMNPVGSNMNHVGPNMNPVTVTSRRANNTSVTMINSNANRISVFEPYPMRDTVQHFCEKHLDKIKAYMDSVSLRLPPPAKCTIEERRSKKSARLQFACGVRGEHCLYGRGLFSLRTSRARAWIHLMFLALQARHHHALSSRDASVASLKHCWDILKAENKTFLTIVTSAFPCLKEQEMLVSELRAAGFYDVFEACTSRDESQDGAHTVTWGCFLCVHPEKADGFVGGAPVMQGPLKEKKGRWRLFRRWRTRYFTLSGGHLSSNSETGGESIDINQIRSVKVSRGARNIPKAFEIFTGDQTLILKPKDGKAAEEWVQCLSIAVAHSQARDVPAKSNSLPARGFTLKNI